MSRFSGAVLTASVARLRVAAGARSVRQEGLGGLDSVGGFQFFFCFVFPKYAHGEEAVFGHRYVPFFFAYTAEEVYR